MVSYLSSGKARQNAQVFSKQGGKGTRPILETIFVGIKLNAPYLENA
jgi:hypothetical protein